MVKQAQERPAGKATPASGGRRSAGSFLLELLTVVGGILIAFSLDAWWDDRAEARWEVTQLHALHDEFSRNLAEFEEIQLSHERQARHVLGMLAEVAGAEPGTPLNFPDSVLSDLVGWRTTDVSSGTLDALLASGRLTGMRNPDLRRLLAEWPAELHDGLEDEELARDFLVYAMAPRLAGEGVMFSAYTAHLGLSNLPEALELEHDIEVTASVALADLLAERLRHLYYNAGSSVRLQTLIGRILEVLEDELATR